MSHSSNSWKAKLTFMGLSRLLLGFWSFTKGAFVVVFGILQVERLEVFARVNIYLLRHNWNTIVYGPAANPAP